MQSKANKLVAVWVLSGNRNFEGRVHPNVRANYLASPPLVVAYSLLGNMREDITTAPLGTDAGWQAGLFEGHLADQQGDRRHRSAVRHPRQVHQALRRGLQGRRSGRRSRSTGERDLSLEFRLHLRAEPALFRGHHDGAEAGRRHHGARILAMLGDNITTDHISPGRQHQEDRPAGEYLGEHQVQQKDFNSYGTRRGNHEVMMRGTFANIRIKNEMVPGVEGGMSKHYPSGEQVAIYDVAMRYKEEGVPLVVFGGKEYGTARRATGRRRAPCCSA